MSEAGVRVMEFGTKGRGTRTRKGEEKKNWKGKAGEKWNGEMEVSIPLPLRNPLYANGRVPRAAREWWLHFICHSPGNDGQLEDGTELLSLGANYKKS